MRRGRRKTSDLGSALDMGLATDSDCSAAATGRGGAAGSHYSSSMFGLRAEGYGECGL